MPNTPNSNDVLPLSVYEDLFNRLQEIPTAQSSVANLFRDVPISTNFSYDFQSSVNINLPWEEPKYIKKLNRRFSKKHPLKLEFVSEPMSEKFVNPRERAKQIKFYKNLLKTDKTLNDDQKDEIHFLIKQNRLGLRLSKTKQKRKLKITYKGRSLLVDEGPNGFFLKNEFKKKLKELTDLLRYDRRQQKQDKSKVKIIRDVRYETVGGVHKNEGSILQLYRQIGLRRVNSLHLPESREPHVGVEIEFFNPHHRDWIANMLVDAKLAKYCRIMTDSSIRATSDKPYGYEFCVLTKESEFREIIEKVCYFLNDIGADTNESCGLHIHLDMRHRDVKKVFNNLVQCQNVLYSLVAPHRLTNQYCIPQGSPQFESANMSHYCAISAHSYRKYNTFEIRMHEGTLNATKINNWISLLTKIANYNNVIERQLLTDVEVYRILGEIA